MSMKKKLPNLKICVDNTESTDDSDVEIHSSDSSEFEKEHVIKIDDNRRKNAAADFAGDDEDVLSIELDMPTERRFLSRSALKNDKLTSYGPRLYENKSGNFVTGLDVTSKEAEEKREKRAKKFGTISNPKQPITDVDLKNLYKSLGINIEKLDEDPRGWRMEAVQLRGTENMSTKDIFEYFSEYAPKNIEWIDDFSCNVIWQDKLTPARALLKLSSSMGDVQIAEKIVDEQMPEAKGDNEVEDTCEEASKKNAEEPKPEEKKDSPPHDLAEAPASKLHDFTSSREPILNVMEDEMMELDYDDNLDLNDEDPIDHAMSTWSNVTQGKKLRTEQTNLRKSIEEKETLSAKEKQSKKIPEKDSDSSEANVKKSSMDGKEDKTSSMDSNRLAGDVQVKKEKQDSKKEKTKPAKEKEKMELDNEVSDSADSSSSSSSSGSSSSSSSSDGSSSLGSSSGSDSESGSSSSSSSFVSNQSKLKKKKTKSERDGERVAKKTLKKPEAQPPLPAAREKGDIPWPPGWWRLGEPHPKAEYLFLRYAMKADKKLPGAEKRSKYYVKHGNPNYGGVIGLISNSRKRRLRNLDRNKPEDESGYEVPDMFKEEDGEVSLTAHSRLAGRLGSVEEGELEEGDDLEKPLLAEGKDLRDVLNGEVETLQPHAETARKDSDEEMDYGAELEKLMRDSGPPAKKRFMRMHADDEEEKIEKRRRLAAATAKKENLSRWTKSNFDAEDHYEAQEKAKPVKKQWVDYDNVEDEDPFNLFGTSKPASSHQLHSDSDNEDEENRLYGGRYGDDDLYDNRHKKSMKMRLGSKIDRLGDSSSSDPVAVTDLRAKLQGRRRADNWN